MKLRGVRILGTGMAVPDHVVTNADLAKLMDTTHDWIVERSGIEQRRFVQGDETPSSLAEIACRQALNRADMTIDEIDCIVVASLSPEVYFPGTASFLQHRLGAGTKPAFDLRAQCSGFIYALSMARLMIASGQYKNVLLCGVDVHSRALDLTTRGRDTAVLFGDGAGALVLSATDNPETGVLGCFLHAQGEFADKLWLESPSNRQSPVMTHEDIDSGRMYPKMDGRFVYKHAITRLPEAVTEVLHHFHLSVPDVEHFIFHQANLRINEKVAEILQIPAHKCPSNIQRYGNCSAASIPLLLAELDAKHALKAGQLVCLAAFGSGFTWGSALIRWS